MGQLSKIIVIYILFLNINFIEAKDLGKMGNSFTIFEEGFLTMINRKLSYIDIEAHKKDFEKIVIKRIAEPKNSLKIPKAKKDRSFIYDPTYIMKEDILLSNGKIIYKAGTKINPLDHMDFDRKLYFIDSTDESQIKWLKQNLQYNKEKNEIRIILVDGNPLKIEEELGQKIYFDQFGELTKRFKICHVPAFAYQNKGEKYIRIVEVNI